MKKIFYTVVVSLVLSGWVPAAAQSQTGNTMTDSGSAESEGTFTDKLDEALRKMVEGIRDQDGTSDQAVRILVRTRPELKEDLASELEQLGVGILKSYRILPAFLIETTTGRIEPIARIREVVRMSLDESMAP